METASIKAIIENNNKLQESLNNFINYHKEKILDIHEIKYGQENEYCISDIIDSTQMVINNVLFLTNNHDFFVRTSTLAERIDIKNSIVSLNGYIINRSYNYCVSTIENLKIKIRLYELYINKDRFMEFNNEIDNLRNSKEQIFNEIKKQAKEQKDILDSNADTIKTYEEDIKGFKEEYITKTSEVKKLIAEAKNALNYKNAEGLSAAFSTQLSDAKGKFNWKTFIWIIGAFLFIGITIFVGMWIVTGWWLDTSTMDNSQMIYSLVGRLSIIPFTIAGAIFCANQYTKQKNIIEDYAYKTTIAKSIIAFSEELREKSPERYTEYLSTILKEIHQDPLRKRGKDKETIPLKESKIAIEKVIELLQSTIKKIEN